MIRNMIVAGCATGILLCGAGQTMAHFGMVIPSENIVTQQKKNIDINLSFSHPFELIGMDMVKPTRFYVVAEGEQTDLLNSLHEAEVMGHQSWATNFKVNRPGVYHFVMEPQPYWEPAEDLSIIHYTKTIVAAFGDDEGWDEPVGLPTEIVPMLRPFGNYAGNSFTGRVLIDGKPAANAEVEVELYNRDGKYQAPGDYHVTQVITADENGVFSFTCPKPGWWGFSALSEADYTIKNPEGEDKGVELGAVLWTYLNEYQLQ